MKPYKNYPGGKNGNGTYQHLINHVPAHKTRIIGTAGNCGLQWNIARAEQTIINDIDPVVILKWELLKFKYQTNEYQTSNLDVLELLTKKEIKNVSECVSITYLKFDFQDVFIYIDLPYLMDSRKSQQKLYQFEAETEHHKQVLEACKKFRFAKIMISHYPCEIYDTLLAGWHTHDYKSMTRHGLADERIYMNYEKPTILHDYSYIGDNFRQREALKRVKTNMVKKLERLEPVLRNSILTQLISEFSAMLEQK